MKPITIGLPLSLMFVDSAQAGNKLPDVVVSIESQRWHFLHVSVEQADKKLAVCGRIDASMRSGTPLKHVDIAAWLADDKWIADTPPAHSPRFLTRCPSSKGGIRFSVKFPSVKRGISFLSDDIQQPQSPLHTQAVPHWISGVLL